MISKTSKISIIGAGNVGADVANALVLLGKCVRVVLFDRTLSKAEGQDAQLTRKIAHGSRP
ncbi:lactate/malate dehydrogenase [Nostoc commune NIES-4072]|uniref:Lactate/malate dehydrogenase n=1 Tax=Nostoc commune NIES-4072 TaxID=2005467 RepID=A0A2R5FKL1_NOSCO|nr:lactate/malate dehydrogenase [Nostoc commune HK-02]GBG19302.1 lactate/malate dehydrogenase [Nostoc commune NIES-4072]